MRVLVVDDNEVVRLILKRMIELLSLGEVVAAASVSEALTLLDGVDRIVLDLMMPGEDGTALLHHLQQTGHRAKVAVLTGAIDASDVAQRARTFKPDLYLNKPIELHELTDWLRLA